MAIATGPILLERDRELDELSSSFQEAQEGRGQLVLVPRRTAAMGVRNA
jgi:hypothetical protein